MIRLTKEQHDVAEQWLGTLRALRTYGHTWFASRYAVWALSEAGLVSVVVGRHEFVPTSFWQITEAGRLALAWAECRFPPAPIVPRLPRKMIARAA